MDRSEGSARLRAWAETELAMGRPSAQHPVDELLAEHELMGHAFAAMDAEAANLARGAAVRQEFWALAVEFVGNFTHLCHQVKEERHLLPALIGHGRVSPRSLDAVHHEHGRERDLTLNLCNAAQDEEGDALLRATTDLLALLQAHLVQEERFLFEAARDLPARSVLALQTCFAATEREALGHKGRRYYLDLVTRLCAKTGHAWNAAS